MHWIIRLLGMPSLQHIRAYMTTVRLRSIRTFYTVSLTYTIANFPSLQDSISNRSDLLKFSMTKRFFDLEEACGGLLSLSTITPGSLGLINYELSWRTTVSLSRTSSKHSAGMGMGMRSSDGRACLFRFQSLHELAPSAYITFIYKCEDTYKEVQKDFPKAHRLTDRSILTQELAAELELAEPAGLIYTCSFTSSSRTLITGCDVSRPLDKCI